MVAVVIRDLDGEAENDENQVSSSYTLLNGLVWAIPVLGFIGTVQGLSQAIGKFERVTKEPVKEFKDKQLDMALDYLRGQIKVAAKASSKKAG